MKKAIILMLALGFAQTNLSIAQSTEDLASKTNKKTITQTVPAKENLQKNDSSETIKNKITTTEEIASESKTKKTVQKVSSKKRKAAKAAILIFLGLTTLYGTDAALEIAVNNLNLQASLPASFFQYYEFGTLASTVNTYLYQIPTTEIQNKINLMIDDIGPIIKPLQFAATINGIKNFVDEKGQSVRNLGTWIKNIITF